MTTSANFKTPVNAEVLVEDCSDSAPGAPHKAQGKEREQVATSRREGGAPLEEIIREAVLDQDKNGEGRRSRRENNRPSIRHSKSGRTRGSAMHEEELAELARFRTRKYHELKELDYQMQILERRGNGGGERHRRQKESFVFDRLERPEGRITLSKQRELALYEKGDQEGKRCRSRTPERDRAHARDRYDIGPPRHGDFCRDVPKKIDKDDQGDSRQAARLALAELTGNPLSEVSRKTRVPSRIKHAQITLHETNTDPIRHSQHYQQAMFAHEDDDATMCKMFPSSLETVALTWFHKLKNESVGSWSQLAEMFVARFLTSRKPPKTFEVLGCE